MTPLSISNKMSGTDVCPCCPKIATSSGQHVRSDSLRTHVKNKHSEKIDAAFIDGGGWAIKVLAPKRIVKIKADKLGYGYCFECFHWIPTAGYYQSTIEQHILDHECKEKQVRQKKAKVIGGKVIQTEKKVNSKELVRAFEKVGYKDQIELTDDIEFDLDKTLKQIKTLTPPPSSDSTLERAKKDKRLVALKIEERENQRRDAIVESQLAEDEDADDEYPMEPEVFDEYEDVIAPLLVDLVRSVPLREKLTNQNKELRIELDKWEDKYDMLTSEKNAEIARLREQLMELSRSTSEERMSLQAENLKLKTQLNNEQTEPVAEVADTIQHVGENNYQLWSLPFQG